MEFAGYFRSRHDALNGIFAAFYAPPRMDQVFFVHALKSTVHVALYTWDRSQPALSLSRDPSGHPSS